MLNEKKIAFIICSNNDLYFDECVWYIGHLHIPPGYEADVICIREAESMAQGYQTAMSESDAKYKIYLHQDVFIYHRQFLNDILHIFRSNQEVGLIGVLGSYRLPSDAFLCSAWNVGSVYVCNFLTVSSWCGYQEKEWTQVQAIDGMLMATQYDLDWREDLMLGWDFYDVSQSLEFLRRGYKIAVPFQNKPWCLHDCGRSKMSHYDEKRKIMLTAYKDFFSEEFSPQYNLEYQPIQERMFEIIRVYIESGKLDEALEIRRRIQNKAVGVNDLQYALNILDIYAAEKESDGKAVSFFSDVYMWDEIRDKYDRIKFALRHAENGTNEESVKFLAASVDEGRLSEEAVRTIIKRSVLDEDKAVKGLAV